MQLKISNEERILKPVSNADPVCRVLIADRDSISSHLLADSLVRNRKYDASAVSATDLLLSLAGGDTDLVVIGAELSSGQQSGFDLADTISRTYPEIVIVLLLNQHTDESVINALRSGARGIFSRRQSIVEFLDCIDHVKKGFIWAGKEETDALLRAFQILPAASFTTSRTTPPLTKREFEVVQCAAKGKTNKNIAIDLGLSEHTVKNYLFRAFDKLGVSSRVELLFYLTIRGHVFGNETQDQLDSGLPVDSIDSDL